MTVLPSYAVLRITDGISNPVNLINTGYGFHLQEWPIGVSTPKGGGVWHDGQLANGRRLALRRATNITDTYTLTVNGVSQDDVITQLQNLRRLLEKAQDYWTTEWQTAPVWIEAVGAFETNLRYALILDYRLSGEDNPYAPPFVGSPVTAVESVSLTLEHGFWLSQPPGVGECVEAAGQQVDWPTGPWTINSALPAGQVYSLIQLASGRLLASSATDKKVWRTDDGGATPWTGSAALANPLVKMVEGGIYVYGFAVDGVYRSGDSGATWANVNAAVAATTDYRALGYRAKDGSIYVRDNTAPKQIMRSTNLGVNFANAGGTISGVLDFVILADSSIYLITNKYDVYKSVDGTTWTWLSAIPKATTTGIAYIFYGGDGYFYVNVFGSPGFTFWRSRDALGWEAITDADLAQFSSDFLLASDGYLYMSKVSGGIYRSLPGGLGWSQASTGFGAYELVERLSTRRIYGAGGAAVLISGALVTVGPPATCADEVFAVNKAHSAQLTNVFVYDASGPTFTAQYPAAAFPFNLLPAATAAGDIAYFGIDSAAPDQGPFNNLVLNLSGPLAATSRTVVWEYWNGAWVALTVQDGTASFVNIGALSVSWAPPADWAVTAINGITAWWVRARLSAVAGATSTPQQATRDVYTANRAGLTVRAADVLGDVPALLRAFLRNRSDGGISGWANRVVLGLRSDARGTVFSPFLNCSDVQLPSGLAIAGTAATVAAASVPAPTGRKYVHTGTGTSTWADQLTFTLSGTLAVAYYGRFRAFLRAQQAAGASGDVRVRLTVKYGSGGNVFTGGYAVFLNTSDWQLLDLGSFIFPTASALNVTEAGNSMAITLQVWSSAARTVNLYDLALLPSDEWIADVVDPALLAAPSGVSAGYTLDVDSVSFPKQERRALVRLNGADNGLVKALYSPMAVGPAVLQADASQHLYALAARYSAGVWYSEPWLLHSARLQAVFRYLSMRGSR
jgi:hypothetical protein